MATHKLDETTKDAFAQRMLDALNGASLTHMASLGYHLGLFDTMDGHYVSRSS